MQVNFTSDADFSIEEILDFLEVKWTEKEVNFFFDEIDRLIKTFDEGIIKYPFYKKN